MTHVALLSSEPIRARAAGIGIRYAEMARALAAAGLRVTLLSPAPDAKASEEARRPPQLPDGVRLGVARTGALAGEIGDAAAVVAQGPLANDAVLELAHLPIAIDLYDPWMIENFAYRDSLGRGVFENDHATWRLQLERGDLFLCSSEAQRLFYLGWLAALGRVHPERHRDDPEHRALVDVVPFTVPAELPPHRPVLPPRADGERRILFGGLYDWLDPWPVLEAIERLDRPGFTLLFVTNPNPSSTPQGALAAVERWCRERGLWGTRVRMVDWVAAERRFDLLRDADVVVATHRPSLETDLSLRTRFLDALAAGVPVIGTEGGALGRDLAAEHAARVVPPGDATAVAEALAEILDAPPGAAARRFAPGARRILERHRPERALAPLIAFCRAPRKDGGARVALPEPGAPAVAVGAERAVARHFLHRLRARLGRAS